MIILWFLVSVVFHELGHFLAAKVQGYKTKFFFKKPTLRKPIHLGLGVVTKENNEIDPKDDLFISLLGPIFSIFLYYLFPEIFLISLYLGVISLIPFVKHSDGWRIYNALHKL